MKTIEEKAKAYDEAKERAKKMTSDLTNLQAIREYIFPELRESEDERIRKEMIEFLREAYSKGNAPEECAKWLVWLDQPKEQKPIFRVGDNIIAKDGTCIPKEPFHIERIEDDCYCDGNSSILICNQDDFQLISQKPSEWREDWREEDIRTRFAFYTYKNEEDDGVLYLSNVFVEEASRNHGFGTKILAAAEKVAEVIGATTICLKVKQDSPANAWYRKRGYGYVAFEDGYDWLEKKLEYMKPVKPVESSTREKIINKAKSEKQVVLVSESDDNAEINWDTRSLEDTKKLLELGLAFINKQLGVKPVEWSEEDEKIFNNIIEKAKGGHWIEVNEITWLINRFKLLRSQPKQEWSEKDKKILQSLHHVMNCADAQNAVKRDGLSVEDVCTFLFSVQPSWKPSEEQMRGLKYFLDYHRPQRNAGTTAWREFDLVESLYEQLRKL